MKSCQEIMRLVSDGLDNELSVKDRLAMKLHLKLCGACRDAAKMLRTIHERANRCSETDDQLAPSETLSVESRSRIILRLQENVNESDNG